MTHPNLEIAKAFCTINPGFTVQPVKHDCHHYTDVNGPEGAQLTFYHDSYRKHVSCSGTYPTDTDGKRCTASDWGVIGYNHQPPMAKVSETREPVAGAKDLTRRVLADYLDLFHQCLVKKAEREKTEGKVDARFKDIFEGVDGVTLEDHYKFSGYQPLYVDGSFDSSGELSLHFKKINDDQAKRMIAIAMETPNS